MNASLKHAQPDRRRAERRTSPELAAYLWNGSLQQQTHVKDISSTGLYLLTNERFAPGDTLSLTLQRKGPIEGNFERRVAVQARAVRWGDDGVAVSFVLPPGMDLRLWQSPLKSSAEQTEPEDILREFRVAGALAFLSRLCPGSSDEIRRLMREGLSNYRVASAIEIALGAERLLAFGSNSDKLRAPANLVLRILEDGSWADAESTQQLWAGLLATSCTLSGRDDSNLVFISLLSQLTAPHVRMMTAACTKASKYMASMERLSSRPIVLSAHEMMQITGTRDMIRIYRDLEYLVDLGLLTTSVKSPSFSPIEGTELMPTSLGLQLFARCHGHRGAAEDYYGVPNGAISEIEPSAAIHSQGSAPTR
ncbi:MAG: PilZ domain-containing protein [Terracidiphilus sp.]